MNMKTRPKQHWLHTQELRRLGEASAWTSLIHVISVDLIRIMRKSDPLEKRNRLVWSWKIRYIYNYICYNCIIIINILNIYISLHLFYPRFISCSYLHESWKCCRAKLRYPILSREKFHESINQSCGSLRCSTINLQKALTKKREIPVSGVFIHKHETIWNELGSTKSPSLPCFQNVPSFTFGRFAQWNQRSDLGFAQFLIFEVCFVVLNIPMVSHRKFHEIHLKEARLRWRCKITSCVSNSGCIPTLNRLLGYSLWI